MENVGSSCTLYVRLSLNYPGDVRYLKTFLKDQCWSQKQVLKETIAKIGYSVKGLVAKVIANGQFG